MVTIGFRNLLLLLALLPAVLVRGRDVGGSGERTWPAAASPLEAELLSDMADGQLEQFTLLEAALIASRVHEPARLQHYLGYFAGLNSRACRLPRREQTPQQQAEHVLQFLHQQVLTGSYLPACTELDRSLEAGDYNCVTATVLYRCLSVAWDLPVITLAQPGHVYCRLAGRESLTIQTTSPHGLVAEPAAGPPQDGRPLSDVQLVAKIYYNRGVHLLAGEAFAAALPLLELACQLDPQDPLAHRNVLACLNNWALAECRAGRYAAALQLLAQGLRLAPDDAAFADNDVYIHGCWARQLCNEGRYDEALELLRAAHRRRPSVELFQRGQALVYEASRVRAQAAAQMATSTAAERPQHRDDPGMDAAAMPGGKLDGRLQGG